MGMKEGKNLGREGTGENEKDRNMEVVEGGKGMREGRTERRKLGMERKAKARREEGGVNIMITDYNTRIIHHSMDLNII